MCFVNVCNKRHSKKKTERERMVGKNINNVDKKILRIVRERLFTLYLHAWQKVFNL